MLHADRVQEIFSLPAQERLRFLIESATDAEEVWVIMNGEQHTYFGDPTGRQSIPVFPDKAFAEAMRQGEWAGGAAQPMDLDEFLGWLELLQPVGITIAACPNPSLNAMIIEPAQLIEALQQEMRWSRGEEE